MYSWVWLILGAALVMLELLTPSGFFLLILGGAAVVVGLLAAVGLLSTWIPQAVAFCIISLVTWRMLGSQLRQRLWQRPPHQGQLVGAIVRVTETITPGASGSGELWGALWRVRNIGTVELPQGSEALVQGSEGITLLVEYKER
jgi:membrane protein implicated in regulation of membrane protease activity